MKNDKRTLGLILFTPLLIVTLLYLLLGESTYQPVIGVTESLMPDIVTSLEEQGAELVIVDKASDQDRLLEDNDVDAVISSDRTGLQIRMLEGNSAKVKKVTDLLKEAAAKLNPAGSMQVTYVYGKADDTVFDTLSYMLLGVLSFFFVFVISGISFVRERTTGTMERLMLSPVTRTGVVFGYGIGYGIFASLQGVLLVLFTKYVLKIDFIGSVPLAILMMILMATTAVLLGALVSIFANNEFQVMQFIPIVIIPQIFFSGIIPIETLPMGLGKLAYLMPVYYGCAGLKDIIIKGYGIEKILLYPTMLLVLNVVLIFFNTMALRKYRKI
jgi:ABC-2 type transport system permease protein